LRDLSGCAASPMPVVGITPVVDVLAGIVEMVCGTRFLSRRSAVDTNRIYQACNRRAGSGVVSNARPEI
jgi:hypothetical protein